MPAALSKSAFGALRSLSAAEPGEVCELCGSALPGPHPHLLEPGQRQILCACEACAVLFGHREAAARFRRIPNEVFRLARFQITDCEWAALQLPIDLAFFVYNSPAGRVVAYYPSPAGCTESQLDLGSWQEIARNNSRVEGMQADVQALLVNRTRGEREYYIAPIDACYKLTGLIRRHWRGFSGGGEVWQHTARFFEELRERAISLETANA